MSPSELRNVFVYLGIYTNKKEIFSFLSDFDTKEHGYLDFEDFVKVITDRNKAFEKDTKRKKFEVFRQLTNRKATLNLEELEKAFFTHGFVLKKEEIKEIYEFLLEKSF